MEVLSVRMQTFYNNQNEWVFVMWRRWMEALKGWRVRFFSKNGSEGVRLPNGQEVHFPSMGAFKGRYAHQCVHVLASGPSMLHFRSERLGQNLAILVNGAIRFYEQGVRHCVWVVSDSRFVHHQPHFWSTVVGMTCFFTPAVIQLIAAHSPGFFARNSVVMIRDVRQMWSDRHLIPPEVAVHDSQHPNIGVSFDISQGFVEAGTVTFIATQLAYYMGAERIVIHGMDILNADQPRFYEQPGERSPCKLLAGKDRIVASFNWLNAMYAERGVQVYNASPVSRDLFQIQFVDDASIHACS